MWGVVVYLHSFLKLTLVEIGRSGSHPVGQSPISGRDTFTFWIGEPIEDQNSYERLKLMKNILLFLTVNSRVVVQSLHIHWMDWNIPSSLSACFHSKHDYNSKLSATFFTSSCFSSFCNTFWAKSYSIAPIFFLFFPCQITENVTSATCGRFHPLWGFPLATIILILSFSYAPHMLAT